MLTLNGLRAAALGAVAPDGSSSEMGLHSAPIPFLGHHGCDLPESGAASSICIIPFCSQPFAASGAER